MESQRPVIITSFGYGHGSPPEAELTADVRVLYRDPHFNPAHKQLTGIHPEIIATVMRTAGVPELINAIASTARACRASAIPGPVRVAVGCTGGRHRSVVIAAELAARLRTAGVPVTLAHRDLHQPVIERARAS